MDILAQSLAARLRTRTMICFEDEDTERRYRHVRGMKKNKFAALLDEKTGKPPEGSF